MYLSKMLLNPRARQVQSEIANLYEMHRTILSGFSDNLREKDRVLYRLETMQQPPYLTVLVQSVLEPNWDHLTEKGYLLQPVDIKTFEPQFHNQQLFLFRLVANPTRKVQGQENANGKRVGLYTPEEQENWLKRKAEQHGFRVRGLQVKPGVLVRGSLVRDTQRHGLKLLQVQFDGVLEVCDPDLFKAAVESGIGSAKGFGCGLLSLARVAST